MRLSALLLSLTLFPSAAFAQAAELFERGRPPPVHEDDFDRRFLRSRFQAALSKGPPAPACAPLLGALLALLGETAPLLHKQDERFYLDPVLLETLQTQLMTPRFPGNVYLVAMVRRVLLDQKMPAAWLETASALHAQGAPIDLAKLRYLADGLHPVDSFLVTLPFLRERYTVEVVRATSLRAAEAWSEFKELYSDRRVAFAGLELVDLTPQRRGRRKVTGDAEPLVAHLRWVPPAPAEGDRIDAMLGPPPREPATRLTARLKGVQFTDLKHLPRGTRVVVQGRLWDLKKGLLELELRDALVFRDPDRSSPPPLVPAAALAQCPLAMNELTGVGLR